MSTKGVAHFGMFMLKRVLTLIEMLKDGTAKERSLLEKLILIF